MSTGPAQRIVQPRKELAVTIATMLVTLVATAILVWHLRGYARANLGNGMALAMGAIFTIVVLLLIHGNLVYFASRLGYFARLRTHRPPPFDQLVASFWHKAEPVTVLVPSYKEDDRTIRQTLLSAALLHYPRKRVVLLLDDPPHPQDQASAALLGTARSIPGELADLLETPRRMVADAIQRRTAAGGSDPHAGVWPLVHLHEDLIAWLRGLAAGMAPTDHTDRHFLDITIDRHIDLLSGSVRGIFDGVMRGDVAASDIEFHYQRLLDTFTVDVTAFERKQYGNLSHEANKAANLNTYIGLIGQYVREHWQFGKLHIQASTTPTPGSVQIPDTTFVLTLDADSMLSPDYALRLAAEFAAPGNERVAVVQTPYTAIPNAPGKLERIAGATTDIQYLVHQGFTWWNATFWVGANALLRKTALDDIRVETTERGYPISKFIQDRTVIEDTESTIDMEANGWSLVNYPERLAYSATPPDFGALVVQRARWANGGLLIAPKAVRNALRNPVRRLPSLLVRLHYLTSIATGSIGLLILLVLPVGSGLFSWSLPVLAAAYFALYGRDLVQSGYRFGDLPRVAAFNLMLLPVNLAGVYKSIRQAVTGRQTPFARTPKVTGRTAAPAWSVMTLWVLFGWTAVAGSAHLVNGEWLNAGYSLVLAIGFGYAIGALVGWRASWDDATHPVRTVFEQARRSATDARGTRRPVDARG